MTQEPSLSMAISVQSNPGVFALLLGSGVSRSAGIPTGWEITLDLVRRLASLNGSESLADPEAWYMSEYDRPPEYSDVLAQVARSPGERQGLLRSYFEPTDRERESDLKTPQASHRAIASLMSTKTIRVVITTNFDRLLEQALNDIGINPTVISTADSVTGSVPLAHAENLIIKVNGDYLDTRILNTETELSNYDERIDGLIDRIFDEFGLVVCGWSGDWDIALKAAFERASNRRYSVYWCHRGDLSDTANRLCDLRSATRLPIEDSDTFFSRLVDQVDTLSQVTAPSPISVDVVVASAKRHMADPNGAIALHDLVTEVVEGTLRKFGSEQYPTDAGFSPEVFTGRVESFERSSSLVRQLGATLGQWVQNERADTVQYLIQRLTSIRQSTSGSTTLMELELYPAVLAFYSIGLNAVARRRFDVLRQVMTSPVHIPHEELDRAGLVLNAWAVGDYRQWRTLDGLEGHHTPQSDRIWEVTNRLIPKSSPAGSDLLAVFDQFEYLVCLNYGYELYRDQPNESNWMPFGRFIWRRAVDGSRMTVINEVQREVDSMGADWSPLKAGFFGGHLSGYEVARDMAREYFAYVQRSIPFI